jgi:hypothetical protein
LEINSDEFAGPCEPKASGVHQLAIQRFLRDFMALHGFNEAEINAGLSRLKAAHDHVEMLERRQQRPEE